MAGYENPYEKLCKGYRQANKILREVNANNQRRLRLITELLILSGHQEDPCIEQAILHLKAAADGLEPFTMESGLTAV